MRLKCAWSNQPWGSTCSYVADVDAVFIEDPFGYRWAIITEVEKISSEEAERRLSGWAATPG